MDQQWTAYSEAPDANRQARYAPHGTTPSQQTPRDAGASAQLKQHNPYASPSAPSRSSTIALQSPSQPGSRGPDFNDNDGDVKMEDADPYKPKYNTQRPNHQQRQSQQFLQQEESAAARRYSPMNMSPTSPYSGGTQHGGQSYTSFTPQVQSSSNRASPTRTNPYMSPPNSYYSPPCTLRAPRRVLFCCKRRLANHQLCSFAPKCTPASTHPVQHEP
jgi:dual specificity protein kinase YAK1